MNEFLESFHHAIDCKLDRHAPRVSDNGADSMASVKVLVSILELPVSERLQLIEAVWDSLTQSPEAVPVSDEVCEDLDRRLEAYYANPTSARPWAEIREELFGKK